MRSFLILCVAAALACGASADCDACIDQRCYVKHLLPGAKGSPADIDRNTNTLYVIDQERHLIKQCNLDNATCRDTAHQLDIYALAVDQRTGDIYGAINSGIGIYKLDLANNKSVLVDSRAMVGHMAFKDKLYHVSLAGGIVINYEEGISRKIAGTEEFVVGYLFVDKKDNIYYKNYPGGIYVIRSQSEAIDSTSFRDDNLHVTVDKNGDATFFNWFTGAVYRVTNGQLAEVGAVKESKYYYELLFDRDNNIIYKIFGDERYHLKQVSNSQCTITIKRDKRIITETEADIK